MKFKVGDKVRIKKNLIVGGSYGGETYVEDMEESAKNHDYVLTVSKVFDCYGDNIEYAMTEDDDWYWTNQMIEKLYVDTKFEAFLKEVVDGSGYENYEGYSKICDLVESTYGDSNKETIQWLTDFYSNFVPKDEVVKKMTKAEIEAELGYKIEIVEE